MDSECFGANKQYIIVAVDDNYSIETYSVDTDEVSDGKIKKITRSITDEFRGYRSYVVYQLIGDKYFDIERWTAKERKEVKNEN